MEGCVVRFFHIDLPLSMTNIKNPRCFKQKLETKSFMFQTKQLFQTIKLAVVSPKMFQIQAVLCVAVAAGMG